MTCVMPAQCPARSVKGGFAPYGFCYPCYYTCLTCILQGGTSEVDHDCNTCSADEFRQSVSQGGSGYECMCMDGYIDVKKETVCEKCWDYIPGCDLCTDETTCTQCFTDLTL